MKKNKKGEFSTVTKVVFAVLCIAVLTFVVYLVLDFLSEGSPIEICRLSVQSAHTLTLAGKSFVNIECPVQKIEIDSGFLKNKDIDDDKVHKVFAEELRKCWYKMGEGALKPFSHEELTKKQICVICSDIELDERMKRHIEKNPELRYVDGFEEYLTNQLIPNKKSTYMDYLSEEFESSFWRIVFFVKIDFGRSGGNTYANDDQIDLLKNHKIVYSFRAREAYEEIPWLSELMREYLPLQKIDRDYSTVTVIEEDHLQELKCQDVYQ